MALILLVGKPASGKSTVAENLYRMLTAENRAVHIITDGHDSDTSNTIHPAQPADHTPTPEPTCARAQLYADSAAEKKTRARFRAATERSVSRSRVTICDTLNSIKGLRYELYCLAKETYVKYCVVYCQQSAEVCMRRDANRTERGQDAYGPQLCKALIEAFEEPQPHLKWDSPLWTVNTSQPAWQNQLLKVPQCIAQGARAPKPTRATRIPQQEPADALGKLDKLTRHVEAILIASLGKGQPVGTRISLPECTQQIHIGCLPKISQLREIRTSYMSLARTFPPRDNTHSTILSEYVQYLNAQLCNAADRP